MNKKITAAVLCLLTLTTAAFTKVFAQDANSEACQMAPNGKVTVGASIDSKTEMLHTARHHWKFKPWKGVVCIGRPDDQEQASESDSQASKKCSGELIYTTHQDGFHNYTPVKMSWGATLTEDDVFKVHFTEDTKSVSVSDAGSDKCTDSHYGTKLAAYVGKFKANAQIEIPADVWILVVRTIKHADHETDLKTYLGKVPNDQSQPYKTELKDKWKYLFVQPGEKIDLLVQEESNDLNAHKKFKVDFEFRFVGHNRCEEILGPYQNFNYSEEKMKSIVFQDPQNEDQRNFYALRLGCLRNKAYLQEGMANSRPNYLVPAMNQLQEKTEKIVSLITKKVKVTDDKGNVEKDSKGQDVEVSALSENEKVNMMFMNDILEMTLLDMGRFALNDLYAYCGMYRKYTREGVRLGTVTELQGIEYSTLTLKRILFLLDRFPVTTLKRFALELQDSENQSATYRSKMRDTPDVHDALKVFKASIVTSGYEGFRKITDLIKVLPKTIMNSVERADILAQLEVAHREAALLESEMIATLHKLNGRKADIITSKLIVKYAEKLEKNVIRLRDQISAHMAWYISDADESSFVSDVATISREYVEGIAGSLMSHSSNRDLSAFVKEEEINKLVNKIEMCLKNAGGGL